MRSFGRGLERRYGEAEAQRRNEVRALSRWGSQIALHLHPDTLVKDHRTVSSWDPTAARRGQRSIIEAALSAEGR